MVIINATILSLFCIWEIDTVFLIKTLKSIMLLTAISFISEIFFDDKPISF